MSMTAWGFFSCSNLDMPLSWRSCCHSFGRPVNSPVEELKPTWVRWTGSYGVLISGRFEVLRKSDMKPNMPFFDLSATVPLRDLVPVEAGGRGSAEGRVSSAAKGRSRGVGVAGTERRLAWGVGKMSLRVAVLAREGRGGGATMEEEEASAKGSWVEERLCLRVRGGGFWRELRTGVFDLKVGGGGGACLVGVSPASLRRSEYSWMDSLEGRWYSMVIFDCRFEGWWWCSGLGLMADMARSGKSRLGYRREATTTC